MEIKIVSEEIHRNALAKGFWEEDNLCQKLLLIVSEITEAMEADRKGLKTTANIEGVNGWVSADDFQLHFVRDVKDTFEDEIADAAIRIFDLARRYNIDLEAHIKAKMRYNNLRPYKHGKKY